MFDKEGNLLAQRDLAARRFLQGILFGLALGLLVDGLMLVIVYLRGGHMTIIK